MPEFIESALVELIQQPIHEEKKSNEGGKYQLFISILRFFAHSSKIGFPRKSE